MREETQQVLELIIEKANKLASFEFAEHVKNVGLGFHAIRSDGDEWVIEFGLPDEKDRDAFLLTFRLFYQENEAISIPKLGMLLNDPDLSETWKSGVAKARQAYFDFLNGHSAYTVDLFDGHPTRREILDTVLYGGLAHVNRPDRLQRLKTWTRDDIRANLLQQEFAAMLVQILGVISYIGNLSEQELKQTLA